MAGLIEACEVHDAVNGRGERAVEPAATLADEFGHAVRDVGFAFGGFDIREMPGES